MGTHNHAQAYEAKERDFRIIFETYRNGSIDVDALSFFLRRMYEMNFGERHRMDSPYEMDDEVKLLMEKLELTAQKDEQI